MKKGFTLIEFIVIIIIIAVLSAVFIVGAIRIEKESVGSRERQIHIEPAENDEDREDGVYWGKSINIDPKKSSVCMSLESYRELLEAN